MVLPMVSVRVDREGRSLRIERRRMRRPERGYLGRRPRRLRESWKIRNPMLLFKRTQHHRQFHVIPLSLQKMMGLLSVPEVLIWMVVVIFLLLLKLLFRANSYRERLPTRHVRHLPHLNHRQVIHNQRPPVKLKVVNKSKGSLQAVRKLCIATLNRKQMILISDVVVHMFLQHLWE